jgi:hypothetical protein
MIKRILDRIKNIKVYSQEIGLEKQGWIKVCIDFFFTFYLYGLCAEDYFIIGNGYTLSKYEKKRFFTLKRAIWLRKKVNQEE